LPFVAQGVVVWLEADVGRQPGSETPAPTAEHDVGVLYEVSRELVDLAM
jgi:hypothetical protein